MVDSNKREIDLQGLILVVVTVAWLAGILLNYWMKLSPLILLIGAAVALVCVILLWRSDPGVLLSLMALWLLLGAWRCAIASPVGDPQAISAFIGTKKLDVRGSIASEPTLESRSRLLTVDVNGVSTDNGSSWQDAHGRIRVLILGSFIDNPYGPNYGDDIELTGKLEGPPPHNTPDIIASMAFPRLNVDANGGNPIIAAIFHLRTTLATIILQSLPQPLAALLVAILLSLHTPALIPLAPTFNETGTAHLIAPSGFKVTILAGLVSGGTRWLYKKRDEKAGPLLPAEKRRGNWRRWLATSLPLLSIGVYTLLSGAGPAAIRAGIMGSMLIIAPRIGRIYNIYTALGFAALLMSMVDPFVLWDAGFQLSFLGTLGIALLSPPLLRLFYVLDGFPFGHDVAEIIAVTLAAQIATWPITAITFSQISFIAPLANVLVVPFFGVSISLGILLCAGGLLFPQSAILIGWIARPLLLYLKTIIPWCSTLPGAYKDVSNFNVNTITMLAWIYYGLLILMICVLFVRWPEQMRAQTINNAPTYFSRRIRLLLQLGAALIIILATGATVLSTQPDGQLTITFLNVGPGQLSEGESILIHTPDGKTVLIDGGLDGASLAQELTNRLPSWQRSLDAVVLTTPRQDHLIGLQDVITRYQVGEVIDAGMLHPNTSYAVWRRTISERGFTYVQARQHTAISLGTQVMLQVLWPPSPLHKSSNEELDNALILRLVAPGFSMLLLGAAALSKYALNDLLFTPDPGFLQANVVQIVGEVGKAFPGALSSVLQLAHPSLVVISPAALSAKLRKAGRTSTTIPTPFAGASWQVIQTAQADTIEISSSGSGWNLV